MDSQKIEEEISSLSEFKKLKEIVVADTILYIKYYQSYENYPFLF